MAGAFKSLHILLTLLLYLAKLVLAQEENQFIHNGFHGANLLLSGIAKIHPNGLLELTNTSYQEIGRAFFRFPLKFNTSPSDNSRLLSFSTNFVFAMVPELPTHGGHGIAFVLAPSVEFTGALATQYFGLFNDTNNGSPSNHVFAIELDSAKSPDFGDINANHVGIDVNNLKSIAAAPVAYYSENEGKNVSLELISGDPMQVWIDFDGMMSLINVTVAPLKTTKPKCPLLSTNVNLSQVFLDSMYVGFSASTGSVSSNHYILGWSFSKNGQAQNLDISNLPSFPPLKESKNKLDVRIQILLIILIILVTTIAAAVYIKRKEQAEIHEDWEKEYGPQRFAYKDLYKATKGFKEKELLGAGGFGRVYKGVLPCSKVEVAVKKVSHNSEHCMKQFVAEIASMGRLRHRNLVQLLGYCRRKGELLLVYEFMPNGSLDKFLFSNERSNLTWVRRYQILKGVAAGLLYLHEEWEQVVLHRDIKASNVLLDAEFNGRLGDFGLAKFHDHGSNLETTYVVGTVGYLAPELTRTGKFTTSTDVFAFGIFMLEMACGRKPLDPHRSAEMMILADWVLDCWRRGDLLGTIDPRLAGNYVVEEMELVLKLGLLCAHPTPAARPSMRQAMQYLDGNAILPEITLDGASYAIVPSHHELSADCASFPNSQDKLSVNELSITESFLSCGR